jgi:RNA polymerase sigma-B factor
MESRSFGVVANRPRVGNHTRRDIPNQIPRREALDGRRSVPELVRIAQGLDTALTSLKHELRRTPTIHEIADRLAASCEQIIEGIEVQAALASRVTSHVGLSGQSVIGQIPKTAWVTCVEERDESFQDTDLRRSVERLAPELSARSRLVVQLRIFENRPLAEIALRTGMSVAHVSRLLNELVKYCQASREPT